MSRGKEKELPSPPLKSNVDGNEVISNISADLASTAESAPGGSTIESADEQSRATSESNSVDYSNPKRRIVYETSKIEESTILETVTENSETNTQTEQSSDSEEKEDVVVSFDDSPQIQEITEPSDPQKENDQIEIVNFSDEDVSSIPAQWPKIKQISEKEIDQGQIKPEVGGRSSEASFNFSDLSDISEPSAEKKPAPVTSTAFSDEEDNDDQIINAPVHILEKSNVLQNAPVDDENSVDISELLDHFTNQIKKAPSNESMI